MYDALRTTWTLINWQLRGKSQPYELSSTQKSNFDIDKTFRALKIIAWPFSAHHAEIYKGKRLDVSYALPFRIKLKGFQICWVDNLLLAHVTLPQLLDAPLQLGAGE